MSIDFYEAQALKPRGNNVREKLIYLRDYYKKTSELEPHDKTQKQFLKNHIPYVNDFEFLLNLSDEDMIKGIESLVDCVYSHYKNNEYSLYGYAYWELQRVIK